MPLDAPTSARAVDRRAQLRALDRQVHADAAPWLHGEVARRMAERLPVIRRTPATVIDWWARAGGGAAVLAQAYPKSRLLSVEPAALGISRPQRPRPGTPWWSPRRWQAVPAPLADDAVPSAAGELLWANMILHGVADPEALMQRWRAALRVDGFLMFSTLGPDTLSALRGLYRDAGWGVAHAPFIDMHDLGDMLMHAGFADPVMDQEHLTLTWPTPQALLAELRSLGGNADPARHAGLRTPRWRDRLLAALRERAAPDGRIALEFELVYGHAFNPAPRPRLAAETRVPLDDLRAMARSSRRSEG